MSSPAQAVPSPTTAIHLLRALLRQASYLPDPVARLYVRTHVVNRFKAYQSQHHFTRRQDAIINARTRPKLRQARKALNFLRRANQGEIPCLHKVLLFAYGRMGRRRYALLDNLLQPDPDAVSTDPFTGLAAPSPLQVLYNSNSRCLQYFDAPKAASETYHSIGFSRRYSRLHAVVASQSASGISSHLGKQLRGSAFKTPVNNVWERPVPIRRARNNVRRWYAMTMSRLLPPLPSEEWDLLHAMATGERPIRLKRQRAAVHELDTESTGDDEHFRTTVCHAIALSKPSRADKPAGIQRPHAITARFMRRLYSRVLALCCKLEYNDEQKRWIVTRAESTTGSSANLHPMPTDEALFAGVDDKGLLPKPPAKPKGPPKLRHTTGKGGRTQFPFFAEFLPEDHPLRMNLEEWKKRSRAGLAAESEAEQTPGR